MSTQSPKPPNSDSPKMIGIDFGGTSVKIGIVIGENTIHQCEPIFTQDYDSPSTLINKVAAVINELKNSHTDIKAVGAGIPGYINTKEGSIHTLPNVKGWEGFLFTKSIYELTQLPCYIDNDANCMAYAEWKHGAGKGIDNLLCLTLGTGLGGGIISNGNLIGGANTTAAEIGQTSIDYQGKAGTHGNSGAVEEYIGNQAIAAEAQESYAKLGINKPVESWSPKALSELADKGDETAIEIWSNVAEKLACAIANTCWLFNPDAVIIGGGVAAVGDHLFTPLRSYLHHRLAPPFRDHLSILPALFGNQAGIIGAAVLAEEKYKLN